MTRARSRSCSPGTGSTILRAAPVASLPENVFHYIYAVLHSPTYRERYAELLKIDFPRIPLTSALDLFRSLCALGKQLVALHLMEFPDPAEPVARFEVPGPRKVEKVTYTADRQRVHINKEQYFSGVEPAAVAARRSEPTLSLGHPHPALPQALFGYWRGHAALVATRS